MHYILFYMVLFSVFESEDDMVVMMAFIHIHSIPFVSSVAKYAYGTLGRVCKRFEIYRKTKDTGYLGRVPDAQEIKISSKKVLAANCLSSFSRSEHYK